MVSKKGADLVKKCYFLILLMALICFVLPASGEEVGYTIDVADEITVGLGETIHLPFERPYSSHYHFNAYCSDPEALKSWSEETPDKTHINTSLPVTGTFDVCFQKKGTFDLHITFQEREIRKISVVVDDLATKASVSQERFVLRAGETVNTGLTLENGAMYNLPTFTKGAYYDNFVQISEDGLTLKGISKGHMKIYVINPLKQDTKRFTTTSDFSKGNFYFMVADGRDHWWGHVRHYIYDALPYFFHEGQ